MVTRLTGPIQLTDPRGSLLDLEALLHDAESRFLANDRRSEARPFTRHSMKRIAIEAASSPSSSAGVSTRLLYVRPNFAIPGDRSSRSSSRWRSPTAGPWSPPRSSRSWGPTRRPRRRTSGPRPGRSEDVKKTHDDLALAALVIPGEQPTEAVDEAAKIFASLGVEVVPKDEVSEWADAVAERVLPLRRPLTGAFPARPTLDVR